MKALKTIVLIAIAFPPALVFGQDHELSAYSTCGNNANAIGKSKLDAVVVGTPKLSQQEATTESVTVTYTLRNLWQPIPKTVMMSVVLLNEKGLYLMDSQPKSRMLFKKDKTFNGNNIDTRRIPEGKYIVAVCMGENHEYVFYDPNNWSKNAVLVVKPGEGKTNLIQPEPFKNKTLLPNK